MFLASNKFDYCYCGMAAICRHFRHVPASVPLLSQPIGTLRIGIWVPGIAEPGSRTLQVMRPNEPLSRALALLMEGTVQDNLVLHQEPGPFYHLF